MKKIKSEKFDAKERLVSANVETDGNKHAVRISMITYIDNENDCQVEEFEEVKYEETEID